ncbi:sensor domain-containing protein [Peribacillus deserti]|uniref:Diguanylate cyclase n=1 Tax=Peribacillus deserti TaxID=673318 RepID=A0A2N5M3H6_9BACI|nr:bifunctional diguanylate cyclase/phosphodiesterase [Peribacillus deserti]PLT28918.1 diguanylate cyclase [Peribacillus deserti]
MKILSSYLKNELDNAKSSERIENIIFEIIFRHVNDMLFIMKVEGDNQFRYLFANAVALEKAAIQEESIGKMIHEVLSPEKSQELIHYYNKSLTSKYAISFKDSGISADGRTYFGESILTPVDDEDGKVKYVVSVTRDITKTVQENKYLLESQERYRSIIDHNMDSIFSLDHKGKILSSNYSAFLTTGYTEKELIKQQIFHYFPESDRKCFKRLFNKSIKGEALESQDLHFTLKKGSFIHVHIRTVPIIISSEIKGIYVIMKNISPQIDNMETIHYMAHHDQLTGLLNRAALLRDLNQVISEDKNRVVELALYNIDLDRFKLLNDSLGHKNGDLLLKDVAMRLSRITGFEYKLYRQGGDEFTVLLHHINKQDAEQFAGVLFNQFKVPFNLGSQDYFISPSIGISMYPNDGLDSETLIQKADAALHKVKERGKAHFQFYSKEILLHQPNIVVMESYLRRSIEKNELSLYYQPQINLQTGRIESLEALLRWHNPTLGYVSPAEFIPLAEDTALIVPIGEWVFEEVCRQIVQWDAKGLQKIKVAVNLSPKQFLQPELADKINALIHKYGIPPCRLEIEITEGAMQNTTESLAIVRKLKDIGLSISVDDFGTGYSSLSYLKQFPLDTLKIDQSFVREILSDKKDAAITTTIIHLAQSLGLEVIAEGVELEEQAGFLKAANCQKVQGFLYSKPLPPWEIEQAFLYKEKSLV